MVISHHIFGVSKFAGFSLSIQPHEKMTISILLSEYGWQKCGGAQVAQVAKTLRRFTMAHSGHKETEREGEEEERLS